MNHRFRLLLIPVLFFGAVGTAWADPAVPNPAGLADGSTYHLVFVSHDTLPAVSDDVAFYNAFVDAQGDEVVSLNWSAIVSTSVADSGGQIDANVNAPVTADVYRLADGTLVATSAAFYTAAHAASVLLDQHGTAKPLGGTWTGTDTSGTAHPTDPMTTAGGEIGLAIGAGTGWIEFATNAATTDNFVYGLSQQLTANDGHTHEAAPIPLPSTLVMAGFGLIAFGRYGWRRRRRA